MGQRTHQLLRKLLTQLADCPSIERSIGNVAHMVIAVAEDPRFADRAVARERRAEQVGKTTAAPEPILINRCESQGIQRYLAHGMSPYPHPLPTGPCPPPLAPPP